MGKCFSELKGSAGRLNRFRRGDMAGMITIADRKKYMSDCYSELCARASSVVSMNSPSSMGRESEVALKEILEKHRNDKGYPDIQVDNEETLLDRGKSFQEFNLIKLTMYGKIYYMPNFDLSRDTFRFRMLKGGENYSKTKLLNRIFSVLMKIGSLCGLYFGIIEVLLPLLTPAPQG